MIYILSCLRVKFLLVETIENIVLYRYKITEGRSRGHLRSYPSYLAKPKIVGMLQGDGKDVERIKAAMRRGPLELVLRPDNLPEWLASIGAVEWDGSDAERLGVKGKGKPKVSSGLGDRMARRSK